MVRGCSSAVSCATLHGMEPALPQPNIPPKYRTRIVKGRTYAYTYAQGRQISLGRHGSAESRERFAAVVRHAGPPPTEGPDATTLVVAELCEHYLESVKARVSRCEIKSSALWLARTAIQTACEEHGYLLVDEFKSRALKAIQTRLTRTPCKVSAGRFRDCPSPPPLSRTEINRRINEIRKIFRWGISEELVPAQIKLSHESVAGLRRGSARETDPREPASVEDVRRVVDYFLNSSDQNHFGLLVNFMLHTGCRPGEAVAIRLNDIKGTPPSWIVLRKHKTSNSTGKPREIPLGPSTGRMVDCARRHWPTFEPSRPLFCRPLPNGDLVALTTNGLLQAVRKACRALECSHFCPYQIRHTTAQLVLNECGSEAVTSALLGHSPSSTIVRTYTKDRKNLAEYGAATLSKALSR